MGRGFSWSVAAVAVGLISGCVTGPAPSTAAPDIPGRSWVHRLQADHPLTGSLWALPDNRAISLAEMTRALDSADFVMLGEKHDNADHHRMQVWLLDRMVQAGRRPAVAFEMLDQDQAQSLKSYLDAHPGDVDRIPDVVGWELTGWPDFAHYRPLFKIAVDAGLPILGASFDRAMIQAIVRQGLNALPSDEINRLGVPVEFAPALKAGLRQEIVEAHCGHLPEPLVDAMTVMQATKDARMARTLFDGSMLAGVDGAVLIAGTGHARNDRGVPWHLSRLAPGRQVVTFGILESHPDSLAPADYADRFVADRLPFDFVWFTPQVNSQNPCDMHAEQLRQRAKSTTNE